MAKGKVGLPKGFTTVAGMGSSWKPTKKGAELQGVIVGFKKVKRRDPKKGENPFTNLATIREADGSEQQVWESAMLRGLFSLKKGAKVFIRYGGIGKAFKKGHNAPRLYTVATGK